MKQLNLFKSGLLATMLSSCLAFSQVTVIPYTGSAATYVVPAGVTSIQIEVWGAQGQALTDEQYDVSTGGLGGYAIGNLSVTPGEVLNVFVGGTGTEDVAGYNGGSLGGYGTPSDGDAGRAGSGGGASDVRQGGTGLANRVIVGGGGGGGGRDYVNGSCQPCGTGGNGGAGGGIVGTNGNDPADPIYGVYFNPGAGGKGGTAVAGGLGGDGPEGIDGNPGILGVGGMGIDGDYSVASGGGGGGYYGGGAGAGVSSGSGKAGGGGAGGSSFIGGVTDASTTAGIRSGNGEIIITILCTPLAITTTDDEICLGESFTLDAESEGGGVITWDGGVTDEVAFTPGASGVFTYTATSDIGDDCPMSIDITVNEIPIVLASADDDNFCLDESVVLAAGGSADIFSWSPTDFDPGVGVHTYTLTGENSLTGCSSTDEITIEVHALPTVTGVADYDEICVGMPLTLTGSGADSYVWSPAGITNGVAFVPGSPGTYMYSVIGSDEFGCTNTSTTSVTVVEDIAITYVTTDDFGGGTGTIDITVTGGVTPYMFDWNNDGTGDFDDTEDLTDLGDGFYVVVVNGATGCSSSKVIQVGNQAGIETNKNELVSVYPNPTTDVITVSVEGNFTFEIVTINGDIVFNGKGVNQKIISLEELASGLYFINLKGDNLNTTLKLIKQ